MTSRVKLILLHYILPVVICIITVFISIRIQYWFDNLYNDRQMLHQVVQWINSQQTKK